MQISEMNIFSCDLLHFIFYLFNEFSVYSKNLLRSTLHVNNFVTRITNFVY